jgi:hypothetical protein
MHSGAARSAARAASEEHLCQKHPRTEPRTARATVAAQSWQSFNPAARLLACGPRGRRKTSYPPLHAPPAPFVLCRYLNLTPEQDSAYTKFVEHLTETNQLHSGHDDKFTLLRFLKARQWDVHKVGPAAPFGQGRSSCLTAVGRLGCTAPLLRARFTQRFQRRRRP